MDEYTFHLLEQVYETWEIDLSDKNNPFYNNDKLQTVESRKKHQSYNFLKHEGFISSNGFNIRFLHTRPLRTEEWGYYFYTECDGDDKSPEGQKMLADLEAVCETLKFVGRYPSK